MSLASLFIYVLVVYGMSNAIIYTDGPFYIFDLYRKIMNKFPSNIGHGSECMICFPFRLGIYLYLLNVFVFPNYYFTPMYSITCSSHLWFIMMFLDGAVASGSTWLLNTVQEYFEYNTPNEPSDNEQ